jgi:hypothetical protein
LIVDLLLLPRVPSPLSCRQVSAKPRS